MMLRNLIVALVVAAAPVSQAQVRVVDSAPQGISPGAVPSSANTPVSSDVYTQIRAMQEEIATLRGLIEEQAYELKQLKQLQLDNYMDIDRRLSAARSASSLPAASMPAVAPEPLAPAPVLPSAPVTEEVDEAELYGAAYDLLNQRQYDASAEKFQQYLSLFPSGSYVSNTYYWLGKIAMQKQDYPQAKKWFTGLLDGFPDSPKVVGTQFDLGRVLFFMGDRQQAKALLDKVAMSGTETAPLAKRFIQDNF